MSKSQKIIIITISILFIFVSLNISAAVVRPMVFNFNLDPGDKRDFQLILTPGSSRENLMLKLYNPIQKINGDLDYNIGDAEINPAINWVRLERNEVILSPGQETVVNAQIDVPFNALGSHTVVIMIEEANDENNSLQQMVNFKVRYAVRININIDSPGQRARAEIKDIKLNKNDAGNPQISINLENISPIYFNAQAEATLRDQDNRLIERLDIISEAAARAKNIITRIYPNSEVIFSGELSQPLYPGEYNLQIYLKYGDNRQLVERINIILEEELRKSGPRRYISFEPDIISKNLKAGSPSTQVIELNNLYNEEIKIKINKKELFDNPSRSLFNIGEVMLRGGEEFLVKSSGSARSVFIFRSPRDASAGGYYGELELEVFDKNDELLEQRKIDLEMLIGEGWEYNAEMNNFKYEKNEELQSFSLELENLSSTHISPGGVVILKNGEEQVIKTINLFAAEELKKLLPGKTVNMLGRTTQIEAGTYSAEIVLTNNNAEIKKITTSVTVN